MSGLVRNALMAAGFVLIAAPAMAYDHQDYAYASGYTAASGQSYSRSVQVQEYGADYAGRPIDYAPGDGPTDFHPQSSAYEARYDEGYAHGGGYREHYQQAAYSHASPPPCPPMGRERVVRCVYRPIREEIRIDTGIFDGGVGVIPSGGGGGGGGFVVVGGGVSAGARAYASASASASVTVRGGGGYKGGGGCHSCGGHKGGKGGYGGKGH